ncbi:Pimeloyl-ACP methyl ester carboxylesterase [Micromonospora nigra]|uniref:Pimeloyl-ACP methyl ester carboxylesterase n=1 Tax=Micromonospora nigra TaxID=145857 RepID=A0A1C6SYA6_9ACTN|nr:alpha/beta hydrolase [Micromonospora nigra]SCL34478.1 Pimeloyl-ACP methyl ester carboxylesterase [Micromonospora nigra]
MVDTAAAEDHGVAPDGLPLTDDYAGPRDLPVETVVSADGTVIAYEKSGSGPPVVVIGGGLNDRAMFTPFAQLMSEHFTVYNYDRRGRGDSEYGDPERFTMDREVEDLAAVIAVTGEPTAVFANCTGGMIAIYAAAHGVPMSKLGLYEPPYNSPKATPAQIAQLKQFIEEDRREEAVTLFARDMVRFITEETLENFKQHPAWQAFKSMAPSALYDAVISVDHNAIPHGLLPKVEVPTLILSGCDSSAAIQAACVTLSQEIPNARLIRLEGEGHLFNQKVGAPLMAEFFAN